MSEPTDLLALAERVEGASGPDRELDAEIFRSIGAPVPFQFANRLVALTFDRERQAYFAPLGDMQVRYEPPAYSASLDAAMTLVPEGAMRRSGDSAVGLMGTFFCDMILEDGTDTHSYAYNEPCAIVAAALRGRAQTPSTASAEGE